MGILTSKPPGKIQSSPEETHLNLEWLQFVSYALLLGTFILYVSARTTTMGLARPTKYVGAASCLFLAAIAWDFQERNADLHSPRVTNVGPVTYVLAERHKGGSIDDRIQIQLPDNSYSPVLETGVIADDISKQPIYKGDQLLINYRTWDTELLEIDELSGQRPNWRYVRSEDGWSRTIGSSILVLLSLAWLLREYLRSRNGEELVYPIDNQNTPKSEIQTLGL